MKQILFFVAAIMLLTSCEKKYRYVETVREQSIVGGASIKEKEKKIISSPSDSAAYIEAYREYCISQKAYSDLRKKGMADFLDIPIGFKLYNEKGEDISNILFTTKLEQEEKIAKRFMAMDNVVGKTDGTTTKSNESVSKIDSVKTKDLLPYFDVKKDEFDPKGKTWYKPKSAPKYTNRNGIYLYFATQEGGTCPLRFRIQYYADDWLFFKKIQFSIDDKAFEYIPSDTEHDNGNGGKIWEWFDEALSGSDKELIYALTEANNAKMKFIGRQYHDIKTITKSQIMDMKRTLELYRAMGGVY